MHRFHEPEELARIQAGQEGADIVLHARAEPSPPSRRADGTAPCQTAGRVLHLLKVFRPSFTGAGIFLERATLVFDELAPNVAHDLLVVETPRPAVPDRAKSALRNITYLQEAPTSPWGVEFALVRWLILNIRQYDVVHFHTHADRFFLGYLLIKLSGKRLVLTATLDDSAPKVIETYSRFYRPLVRAILRMFDAFIAISPKLYDESATVLAARKLHLIPIGVAIPAAPERQRDATRAAYGLSPDDVALICVGGICDRKDPMFLVEQMATIAAFSPHAKLVVVGPTLEGDHHARMLDYIEQKNLKGRVILTGEVRDPYPLFAAADIVVFASHLEGFGCAVTEGMAHGLPAIVRILPGVNDLFVRHGETGFFYTSSDEYLVAIRRLIQDPSLRRKMGMAARKLVAEEFDNLRNAERIMGVYGFAPPGARIG